MEQETTLQRHNRDQQRSQSLQPHLVLPEKENTKEIKRATPYVWHQRNIHLALHLTL